MVQMGKKETLWETCLANNVFLAGPVSSIQFCVYVRVRCAQIYVYALCVERKQTLWERCLTTMYSKRVLFIDTIFFSLYVSDGAGCSVYCSGTPLLLSSNIKYQLTTPVQTVSFSSPNHQLIRSHSGG